MKSTRRRFIYFTLLLVLLNRIKTSHGVKEKEAQEPDEEPVLFTTRGFNMDVPVDDNNQRYIVKFNSESGFRSVSYDAQNDGTHIMELTMERSEVMTLRTLEDVQRMEERDDVEYVERDHKVYLQAEGSSQYGFRMVKASAVSDEFMYNQKICIIDSGYARSHPDLPNGQSRVTGTSNGAGSWFKDGNGHGTHVAGVIAALENDEGIVGINQGGFLKLHIVRVFGNNGNWAWASNLVAAVNACVNNGANVINMSLGGPEYSQFEKDAFQKIYNDGVLLVGAGGNDGSTNYLYPAAYPSVIGVAAVNSNQQVASFSQKNNQIDLAAPGVAIRSTIPPNGYVPLSGTSMACPHVSGVAALVWSHFPDKSAQEIRDALEKSADDKGLPGKDNKYGHGIVNAKRAFDYLSDNCVDTCQNSPEYWHDSDGAEYDCDWYSADENCELYGNDYENYGKTANDACCACGGGEIVTCNGDPPTKSPTVSPTKAPVKPSRPTMSSPSQKPTNTRSRPPTRNPTTRSPTAGPTRTPNKPPTRSPTVSPTVTPTRSPTKEPIYETSSPTHENFDDDYVDDDNNDDYVDDDNNDDYVDDDNNDEECIDEPEGWYDADGEEYNCEWYGEPGENRCNNFGELYENFGTTASEACCVCGGGSVPCDDVPDWHDADGEEYDCAWYSEFLRCEKYGDLFENYGYTANEACCVCKTRVYDR